MPEKTLVQSVCVQEYAAGVLDNGQVAGIPGVAVVQWESLWEGIHLIYVNGEIAQTIEDPLQRIALVSVPLSGPSVIEVLPIERFIENNNLELFWQPWRDSQKELFWNHRQDMKDIEIIRFEYGLTEENVTGYTIEVPYRDESACLWGWGLSQFGECDFGYEGNDCCGFGLGSFGGGELGFDSLSGRVHTDVLANGQYVVNATFLDKQGETLGDHDECCEFVVDRIADPVQMTIMDYDPVSDQLTFNLGDTNND